MAHLVHSKNYGKLVGHLIYKGIQSIADQKPVFVNLTRDFLVGKLPLPLDKNQLVVEILEDIEIDTEIVGAIDSLSEQGYALALDDYVFTEDKATIFDKIHIIKIDLPECDLDKHAADLKALKQRGIKLLAEKVETHEEYEQCKALGFGYFQGYYFSKPKLMSKQSIKANRLAVLQVLSMLQDPNYEFDQLFEELGD